MKFSYLIIILLLAGNLAATLFTSTQTAQSPVVFQLDEGEAVEDSQLESEMEAALDQEEEVFDAEMEKLDRLEIVAATEVAARRYGRQKRLLEIAQTRYLERLKIYHAQFIMLEMRGTPGLFAGELPEKEILAHVEMLESAEELLELLDILLESGYDNSAELRLTEWVELHKEVTNAVKSPLPFSDLALVDAEKALETAEYRKISSIVNQSAVRLASSRIEEIQGDISSMLSGRNSAVPALLQEVPSVFKPFFDFFR